MPRINITETAKAVHDIDFNASGDLRKGLHFKLMASTHMAIRIQSFRLKLSVQEMFEELSRRIIMEDPAVIGILLELQRAKRNREYQKITSMDANDIYDLLEGE